VDNSIKLKELQVITRALRKGAKGLGFFWVGGEDGVFHPFPKEVFFKRLG
jgi:hypothetical protein